jgi:hypothetical protein
MCLVNRGSSEGFSCVNECAARKSIIGIAQSVQGVLRVGRAVFDSGQEQDISLFSTSSRRALGPHPTSYPMSTEGYFPRVKRTGRDAYHSFLFSGEFKNGGAIPPLPDTSSWRGKPREDLTSLPCSKKGYLYLSFHYTYFSVTLSPPL